MSKRSALGLLAAMSLVAALAGLGAAAGQAAIGKPTIQRFDFDETAVDDGLTEACGVPVTFHAQGHLIIRTIQGQRTGLFEVLTLSDGVTLTAGDKTYSFQESRVEVVRVTPDRLSIFMTMGRLPFEYTGALVFVFETGEVLVEPHHSLEGQLEAACAALT